MKIGILKDIKKGEYRVIATPCEVATLIEDGNEVFVQHDAGSRAGFEDAEYAEAGYQAVAEERLAAYQAGSSTKLLNETAEEVDLK